MLRSETGHTHIVTHVVITAAAGVGALLSAPACACSPACHVGIQVGRARKDDLHYFAEEGTDACTCLKRDAKE